MCVALMHCGCMHICVVPTSRKMLVLYLLMFDRAMHPVFCHML